MKTRLKQLIFLTALSVISIVLYGCFSTNFSISKNQKFHVYECKNEKLIYNLFDSTKVIIYPGTTQDQTILNLFENGILTVKILTDAFKNEYRWYEFDAIQSEIVKIPSNICSDKTDDNTVFIQFSSSKTDSDGSTLHDIEYFTGIDSGLYCFELKQIKQGHFAIRFTGFIL